MRASQGNPGPCIHPSTTVFESALAGLNGMGVWWSMFHEAEAQAREASQRGPARVRHYRYNSAAALAVSIFTRTDPKPSLWVEIL